jgi:hypothetical protein
MRAHQIDQLAEGYRLRLTDKSGVVGFPQFGRFRGDDFIGAGDEDQRAPPMKSSTKQSAKAVITSAEPMRKASAYSRDLRVCMGFDLLGLGVDGLNQTDSEVGFVALVVVGNRDSGVVTED